MSKSLLLLGFITIALYQFCHCEEGAAASASSAAASSAAYSLPKDIGIHGGENVKSSPSCQCVPVEKCPSSQANQQQKPGSNLPESPPAPGSSNTPESPPVPPGQQGGSSASSGAGALQGGIVPIDESNTQNGNIPVIGGGNGGGTSPKTDGSGQLDLRIVNRPPRPGGVQCLNGQVYCCDLGNPGNGGPSAYTTCGSRNIIDIPGKPLEYGDAKFGAYPWMAVILGRGNNYVGAAALISPSYVLTAAHKITALQPGTPIKARFGEWNAQADDEPYKNVEIDVAEIMIHPGFNPRNLQNDIALLRLATPIDTLSYPHIKQVCLPQPGYQYAGQRCWVAGFGKDAFGAGKHSYIMKEVDVPILESNDCEKRLRSTRLGRSFQLNRLSFICAGGEDGKDACTGDGGSPLVCETGHGGVWEVVGLTAWGIGCGDYGIPGVYVNVPSYLGWINQQIYK